MLLTAVIAAACFPQVHATALDYSYAGTIYTLDKTPNNSTGILTNSLYVTTKSESEGQKEWEVSTNATSTNTNNSWQNYFFQNDYNTLRIDSANVEYGYKFADFTLAGLIIEAEGSSIKAFSQSTAERYITFGKDDLTAQSYFGGNFVLDNSINSSTFGIKLKGTQNWYIEENKTVTISTNNGIVNEGTWNLAGKGTLAINNAITGENGSLVFGEGVKLSYTGKVSNTSALQHGTYGFKSNRTGDLLDGNTANREVTVLYNGSTYTMATDGTIAGLADNTYYIEGNVSASTIKGNDDLSTASDYQLKSGIFTLDEDFTLSGNSAITGTTIKNHDDYTTAKLIIGSGTTTVNSTSETLQSNIEIASGATLQFLGTGCDAIKYGQTNREINVYGTMDVGTTRQTVGNWTFNLKGGTIQGAGQPSQSNIGLDVHAKGYINALALDGATAATPTVSTISTKVRYNGALNINVEKDARLDMTGAIIAGNKLTKTGSGTLRLANNDNNYSDKAFDVTGGTLELRDNAVTMNGAVKVNNGAELAIVNTDNDNSTYTLANVTLDNGSLLTQGTTSAYTTTLTNLSVGAGGGTIGTDYGIVPGHSYETTFVVTNLSGTGDLTVTSKSNTASAMTVRLDGGTGYTGTVKIQNKTGATSGTRVTNLDLNSSTALASAVVELGGGKEDTSQVTTNLVIGASQASVKGIQDAADRKSIGDVICRSGDNVGTLTINTGDESYTTKSGVKHAINLVKQGSGTQTFGGSMSEFGGNDANKDRASVDGTIKIEGGTLAFTKADDSMRVASLTLSGGTLEVAGSLTLDALSLDLSKYATTQLEYQLVSAGTLSLGAGVNLATLGSTVGEYTATVTQRGQNLWLVYTATPETLEVSSASLSGSVLTLTLGTDTTLTAGANVDLTLSADALASIQGVSGLVDLKLVAGNGTFSSVLGSEDFVNVSFYGTYAGEANGQYRVEYIPEPTTATLSLLALCGLAARRRRR